MTSLVNERSVSSFLRDLAPVAVYTYSRVEHFKRTVDALARNRLAKETVLYVVSDGPKTPEVVPLVSAIRDIADDLRGFREVVKIYRSENLGIGTSPLLAEQQIIADHGKIISMEDDNVTATNFLCFINQGLAHFEGDDTVFSVCGYVPPVLPGRQLHGDFFWYPWNMAWGYGVWKRQYDRIYPLVNPYNEFRRNGVLKRMVKAGGLYITDSMRRDAAGQGKFLDSVLCARMFVQGMRAVIPTSSKVLNIGLDGSGTSSRRKTDKYSVSLDESEKSEFDFNSPSKDGEDINKAVKALFNGSWATRCARSLGFYDQALRLKNRIAERREMTHAWLGNMDSKS